MSNELEQKAHELLAKHYKFERFEGRNNNIWGKDYSMVVTRSFLNYLRDYGNACISRHESNTGRAMWFSLSDLA